MLALGTRLIGDVPGIARASFFKGTGGASLKVNIYTV